MELTHTFTVPVDRDTAWAAFQDIGSVAECFPGAAVTSTEGDTFTGTVKVKLGPIALQYAGSGEFVERDVAAYRMAIKAQGKDKRGNGTAGADVSATFADAGAGATRVEVVTELHITGKPAQFGRGVIQDVSDKLLGQFVDCLESKAGPPAAGVPEPEAGSGDLTVPAGVTVPEVVGLPGDTAAVDSSASSPGPVPAPPSASAGPAASPTRGDDALDLGATVLPALLRSYGKPAAGLAAVLVLLVWLVRRRR